MIRHQNLLSTVHSASRHVDGFFTNNLLYLTFLYFLCLNASLWWTQHTLSDPATSHQWVQARFMSPAPVSSGHWKFPPTIMLPAVVSAKLSSGKHKLSKTNQPIKTLRAPIENTQGSYLHYLHYKIPFNTNSEKRISRFTRFKLSTMDDKTASNSQEVTGFLANKRHIFFILFDSW